MEQQIEEAFQLIVSNWMFGSEDKYGVDEFSNLREDVANLMKKSLPLKFLLPAFPAKSPNKVEKVLGIAPDFLEVKALCCMLKTLRLLEEIYPHGVKLVLMSDYHTFDQYVGVSEEEYNVYFNGLRDIIHQLGGDDIIDLICLSNFPHFESTETALISTKLQDDFGNANLVANFDAIIKSGNDKEMMAKYLGMKSFMAHDLLISLPGSKKEKERIIKNAAKGMIAQGVALDMFLKTQSFITNYIRLTIHAHHPRTGKYCVDFFKDCKSNGKLIREASNFWGIVRYSVSSGALLKKSVEKNKPKRNPLNRSRSECIEFEHVIKTPWHSTIAFDSRVGRFKVDRKAEIMRSDADDHSDDSLVPVKFEGRTWMFLWVEYTDEFLSENEKPELEAEMFKPNCGIMIKSKSDGIPIEAIQQRSISYLIREFGVVVLRGFNQFKSEDEMIEYYGREQNLIHWKFGPIHKVRHIENHPSLVDSQLPLPLHFDLMFPPKYFNISQEKYAYGDYIPREFILYCKWIGADFEGGETTFIDCLGAVRSLSGMKCRLWQNTTVKYETFLQQKEVGGKELYFGGKGNGYIYPLVMRCPWTGKYYLRCNHLM